MFCPLMSLGTPKISLGLDLDRTWLSAVRGRQGDPMAGFKAILGLMYPVCYRRRNRKQPQKMGILVRNLASVRQPRMLTSMGKYCSGFCKLDVYGSVHRNINLIERTNKMQPCSRIYYSSIS